MLHNGWLEGAALSGLGQGDLSRGDLDGALSHLRAALAVRVQTGDRRYEADTRYRLGLAYLAGERGVEAREELERALAASREIADPHLEALVLHGLGRVHAAAGDATTARGYFRLALTLRLRITDTAHAETVRADLADLDRAAALG